MLPALFGFKIKVNRYKKEAIIPKKIEESKTNALKIVEFVLEKQGEDVVVLDVSKISGICDCFVICTGTSERHVKALSIDVLRQSKKNKIRVRHWEDDKEGRWILVDFFDVILHIFLDEARELYDLESLWSSAEKIYPLK
ncbi:MAG: ribosome silencing factor [Candidatus Omnitrophica bacterium]|nr:ribosome silencing factor [Candidatus Omnitrophota bacterium]